MNYVRLSQGLNHNQLIPESDDVYERIKSKKHLDWYTSLYTYNDKHFEQFKQTRSVAGISDLTTTRLLFDFDSAKDVDQAKKDALEICNRLIEVGVPKEKILCFWSGNKGFHVETLLNQQLNRQQFVNITHHLAADLKTFDTSINDHARIIRTPLTKHPKSGLYKIPLSVEDLSTLSVQEIQENAKDISGYDEKDLDGKLWVIDLPAAMIPYQDMEYKKVSKELLPKVIDNPFDVNSVDFSLTPKWLSKEKYALMNGHFLGSSSTDVGERNSAFMILAATYKAQGFSEEHALGLLTATAVKQAELTGEEQYGEEQLKKEILATVYSSLWRGGTFGKNEELLVRTRERFGILEEEISTDLVTVSDVGLGFKTFAKDIEKNVVKSGLKSLDNSVTLTSGMMCALLASPGAGKTSFANLFVENVCHSGENALYFSLDMYKYLLFCRLVQRHSGVDMMKIFDSFKSEEPDESLISAYSKVVDGYKNCIFSFSSGPTPEDIENKIIQDKKQRGKEPKLVVIDYLEKIRSPFSDSTASSAYIVSRLSDIAKKHNTLILLLVQPNKMAGDPRDSFTSYRSIKGSSAIEQEARVILGLSRPAYSPQGETPDIFASIDILKNTMGSLGRLDFGWSGIQGAFTELDLQGKRDLRKLRDDLEAKKLTNLDI